MSELDTPSGQRTFGQYELLEELASGGQGVVYRARLPGFSSQVAIKVLLSHSPQDVRRFRQEGQVLARLEHPNLPRVLDLGEHQGRPYMVMELLDGKDLKAKVREQGALPIEQSVEVLGKAIEEGETEGAPQKLERLLETHPELR